MDSKQNISQRIYWPTIGWKTAFPEEQGVDSTRMAIAFNLLQKSFPSICKIVIVKNGYIVFDAYNEKPYEPVISKVIKKTLSTFIRITKKPGDTLKEQRNNCHNSRSVTKSIMSILLGIAIENRFIDSIDDSISKYLSEKYTGIDVEKNVISLRHLISMTSGIASIENGINAIKMLTSDGDWVKYILRLPLVSKPGDKFLYNSANAHLLSAIISQATKMSTVDFAKKFLFEPLGITDFYWEKDLRGVNFGGGNLFLTPYDMAKVGYLYLNKGLWDEKTIVSKQWIEESLCSYFDLGYGYHYGYLWYIRNEIATSTNKEFVTYSAAGTGGQRIYFIPDLDIVIAVTSRTDFTKDKSYLLNNAIKEFI